MTEETPSPLEALKHLNRRLNAVKREETKKEEQAQTDSNFGQAMGLAMRIGVELVAGVLVGGVLGFLLDKWLKTSPWGIIILLFLGGVAGFMNMIRSITGNTSTIGHSSSAFRRRQKQKKDDISA